MAELSYAGDEMMHALSRDANITTTTTLGDQLKASTMIIAFMNSILATIVAFLAILCAQLIYSLMLSDVEEKTYEFGMIRCLGFNTKNMMAVITTQAFTFAIPGLCTGLMLAAVLNVVLREMLYTVAQNESTYNLSTSSVCIGLSIGIILPLVSNIIPIQKALGKTLRASLDLYHRSVNEISVSVKSAAEYGLSIN